MRAVISSFDSLIMCGERQSRGNIYIYGCVHLLGMGNEKWDKGIKWENCHGAWRGDYVSD